MADDLINLPDVILDETEENREAAASIEEEMHAEEEEEGEERPSEEGERREDAAARSDREEADFSGMELGDEDMIDDEVPNCPREEEVNINEDGNYGDDEYSERTIRNDELIHSEDNNEEFEENDGEYHEDIIQSPSGGNEESSERNETIEKGEDNQGDDEEETEEKSEEKDDDGDEREKEAIEEEERETEEIRDDEEEVEERGENEEEIREDNDDEEKEAEIREDNDDEEKEEEIREDNDDEEKEEEIREDNDDEEKEEDQTASHSLPPDGPSGSDEIIEEPEENVIDEDPLESTSDNIEEDTVNSTVVLDGEDTVENPVEDFMEDTVEDIEEDIGEDNVEDTEDNIVQDPMEDIEESPMEVPVEETIEESIEGAVVETEENPSENTVEDTIQDPMEGTFANTGESPFEVPMEDSVKDTGEDNTGNEDTVVRIQDDAEEEMREELQITDGKEGDEDEEERTETDQTIPILQLMEDKDEETNQDERREGDVMVTDKKDDEDDEDIQFLEMVLPAVTLPIPLSTGEGTIQPMQKMLSPRKMDGLSIVESSSGSQAVTQTQLHNQLERPQGYLLQQGGFQQIGVPVMDDSMGRRMKISGGIGSGGTVVINQSPMMTTASSSSSSSSSTRSNPLSSLPPPRSTPIVPLPPFERNQKEKERRKRKVVEEKEKEKSEEPEPEEFCMGDQRRLRPPVYYDDAPSSWRTAEGVHTIRMDKIVLPTKVPSREKWVGMDLRTYEGSENVDDIYTVSRIISWRDEGNEYDMLQEAIKQKEALAALAAKEAKGNSSRPPNQGKEQRMKSPRPSIQSSNIPSIGVRGNTGGQTSTHVRLAPPPPTQIREVDRENHKAQVLQKIESARRGYAAAREASIMRMGTTYQIPQADGTIKEFVLAHLPIEEAQRPGFIQVLPQSVPSTSSVPPSNQSPVKVVINQRPPVVSPPNPPSSTAVNVTPPGADDLSTRYARYLAQMAAKNGQQ